MRPVMLPRYGEESLADVLPSVLAAMGVRGEENVLGLQSAPRYCVLLVDGLGWHLLKGNQSAAPFLSSLLAAGRAITAGVPTTTATSLTSLGTGLPPGRHGVVGYTSRLPGTNELLNALSWDQPVDPTAYQPYPTVFERAAREGIATSVVSKRRFRQSGLTTVALRSPGFRGADTAGERIAATIQAVTEGTRSLVYVYDGDIDFTGHRQGCQSPAWRYELIQIDRFAEQIYDQLPGDSVLVVTADHGMVDVPYEARVDADATPALQDGVTLIGGEARLRHVYTRQGAAREVAAAWSEVMGERAIVLAREQAIAAGWFGAVEERVADRLGDVIVASVGSSAVDLRTTFPLEAALVGLHGSVTDEEMLVPLLVAAG